MLFIYLFVTNFATVVEITTHIVKVIIFRGPSGKINPDLMYSISGKKNSIATINLNKVH